MDLRQDDGIHIRMERIFYLYCVLFYNNIYFENTALGVEWFCVAKGLAKPGPSLWRATEHRLEKGALPI